MSCCPTRLRPLCFTILFVVLVALGGVALWQWCYTLDSTTKVLDEAFADRQAGSILDRVQILDTVNTSASKLAKALSPSVQSKHLPFSEIENQVAPSLFLALSTIPLLSQASYLRGDGMFYSYQRDTNQSLVVFSNTSWSSSSNHLGHVWYGMTVHSDTGLPYGDAINLTQSSTYSSAWIEMTLKHDSNTVLIAQPPQKGHDELSLIFNAHLQEQKGVVSLGIPLDSFVEHVFKGLDGRAMYLATKDGEVLARKRDNVISVDITEQKIASDDLCGSTSHSFLMTNMVLNAKQYQLHCVPIYVVGIQMVSVVALPANDALQHVRKMGIAVLSELVVMLIVVGFANCVMLQFTRLYQKKEIFLNSSLMKEKQATQQAERKSMNKSLAFASASHDIRNSIAGITGLIELSRGGVSERSQVYNNLDQMSVCASKLLDILNSVLDTSKVEAGKMQLEEVEFDMAQVIEESVDIFHVVALKKGLEVIWDPCDGSILKTAKVRGDCKRLKQILDNLLGNAVKFTPKGHVVVRAWAKRASPQGSTLPSKPGCQPRNMWGSLGCLFYRGDDDGSYLDLKSADLAFSNTNSMEFIFEIDDTGIGIPKEKRASAFENYVQVKESSHQGEQGTGLGLGIVQSYVRLMGGDIAILDKMISEKGTCFRFNIFLKSVEATGESGREIISTINQVSNEPQALEIPSSAGLQQPGLHPVIRSDDKFLGFHKDLKKEGMYIHALIFVQGEETKRIAKGWLMNFGVRVWDASSMEQFGPMLEKLQSGLVSSYPNSSGSHRVHSNGSSPSFCTERGETDGSSSVKGGLDHGSFLKRMGSKRTMTHVLLILDLFFKPPSEMISTLKSFVKDVNRHQYKIICLADSDDPLAELRMLDGGQTLCDLTLRKPLHGSRLCTVLEIIQEFEGPNEGKQPESMIQIVTEEGIDVPSQTGSSKGSKQVSFGSTSPGPGAHVHEKHGPETRSADNKPLSGINVLVVEDTLPLRRIASAILSQLGAGVTVAENGLRAVSLVHDALENFAFKSPLLKNFPYDLILMDCEMPIMNGYEATRQIRMEEKRKGLHIPIVATSAHDSDEHMHKSIEAGMDFHLTKPLQRQKILDVIHRVNKTNVHESSIV